MRCGGGGMERLARELQQPVDAVASGHLKSTLHLASLTPGTSSLVLPAGVTSVMMEIGCSDFDTLDTQLSRPSKNQSFLLSFEPLLDKYAVLLARRTGRFHGASRDRSVPLGHHHPRGVILPLAVTPYGGPINFSVAKTAGCSSMLPIANARAAATGWCAPQLESRQVPSLSPDGARADSFAHPHHAAQDRRPGRRFLSGESGAGVAPPPARGGHTARNALPTCPPLYLGQVMCDSTFEYMRSIGYASNLKGGCPPGRNATTGKCNAHVTTGFFCCETNAVYTRL